MPKTPCHCCGGNYQWNWEEAFEKFGFGDGDGQVMTYAVENVLIDAGYTVTTGTWCLHNTVVESIIRDGVEFIPDTAEVGYDEPRLYLPKEIVQLLDRELGEHVEVAL